ncbi:MAG: fibronectin type III domain-containing protein [Lachnospiraceae bacterium]|nr:fibronectin type III domain-containing protein [Lachnospiraceae bacterium]
MRKRLLAFTISMLLTLVCVIPTVLFAEEEEVIVEAPASASYSELPNIGSEIGNGSVVVLSWATVDSVDGYELFRSERESENSSFTAYTFLASVQGVETYTDDTTISYKYYKYQVRAYREVNGVVYYSDFTDILGTIHTIGTLKEMKYFYAEPKSGVTMRLSWEPFPGSTYYKIVMKTDGSDTYSVVKTCQGNQTNTSVTGLTAGTKYYFRIQVFRRESLHLFYIGKSVEIEAVAIATPSLDAHISDKGEVTVAWSKASRTDGYEIYRSESENGPYQYIQSVQNVLTYQDKSAETGKTYYYKVRAYKEIDGKVYYGGYSEAAKPMKAKYEGLKVSPKSGVTMNLSWTTVPGAGSYEIWHRTDNSEYEYIKTAGRSQTSTSHTGLKAGTMHYYKLVIKDTDGNYLSESTEVCAVTLATPSITDVYIEWSKGYEQLTWSKASGADGYNIYLCVGDENGTFQYLVSVVGAESYKHKALNAENYYKIRAYKKVDGKVYYGGYSEAKGAYEFEYFHPG